MIYHGDCLDVMAGMEPESVDAVVTDPPYGLEFMGKEWDKLGAGIEATTDTVWTDRAPGSTLPFGGAGKRVRYGANAVSMQSWHARWAEAAYRVARPSSYLLAFGGTRTVHRMTVALEDAGWIIRDMLVWAYASGFPKSKASLKPAWEPIVMARKPGLLRMLAIDECRIPSEGHLQWAEPRDMGYGRGTDNGSVAAEVNPAGRWPANVILTDPIFDGGVEGVVGGGETNRAWTAPSSGAYDATGYNLTPPAGAAGPLYGDSGTYSRFFLIPKADRGDREPILPSGIGGIGALRDGARQSSPRENQHPTVKPTELMRHLVRLVTPSGGTVLDPFLGSGTTGIACELEGFPWIGIEKEAEYVQIAEARLLGTQRGMGLSA